MEIQSFSDRIRPMKVKQIILTVKAPEGSQRVVYSPEGRVLSGDEGRAIKLGSTTSHRRAITIRGTKGESIHATVNIHDKSRTTSSGNLDSVNAILQDAKSYLLRTSMANGAGDAHHQHEPTTATEAPERALDPAGDAGDIAATLSA